MNLFVCVFKGVGGMFVFIEKVEGVYIIDSDGKCYIDYVGFWGLMVLGYNYFVIIDVVLKVVFNGLSFGVLIESEIMFVELVCKFVFLIELV